jgi:hypothetical protein
MTQADYARHRGVSRQAISKAVAAGKIPVKDGGLIDPAEADFARGETRERINLGEGQMRPAAPEVPDDRPSSTAKLTEYKAYDAGYRAKLTQLELQKQIGKLCDKAEVDRHTFDVQRRLRDRMLSVGGNCAERLAVLDDPAVIQALIDDEIRKQLAGLADELDAAFAEVADAA